MLVIDYYIFVMFIPDPAHTELPKSPITEQKSPTSYQRSPKVRSMGLSSPQVSLRSPSRTEKIFDFGESDYRPSKSPRSPRSPMKFSYDDEIRDIRDVPSKSKY